MAVLVRERKTCAVGSGKKGSGSFPEIAGRIDGVELAAFDDGVEKASHFDATSGFAAQVVFPAQDGAAKRPFGGIVVERHLRGF